MPGPANTAIGPIDDWKHVAWSDESRFQLYRADGRVRVWRKPHKSMGPTCQQGTVQSGGASVVVWSLCSWSEMEPLIRLETALTGDKDNNATPPFSTRWRCKDASEAHSHFTIPRHHSYEDSCSHSVVKRVCSSSFVLLVLYVPLVRFPLLPMLVRFHQSSSSLPSVPLGLVFPLVL
ncbi:hypothetical protein AVEN_52041-2 [Araneus ventricosus]|uniref:Transposable element Tc1 transposase n=1 Tax=Araneus ventricosus TaxID=182803 RepID=A0A4Y2CHS6_ARAVE|nr:hypothetical protein AVEN_52041-2 [Araneus ventricosus]